LFNFFKIKNKNKIVTFNCEILELILNNLQLIHQSFFSSSASVVEGHKYCHIHSQNICSILIVDGLLLFGVRVIGSLIPKVVAIGCGPFIHSLGVELEYNNYIATSECGTIAS
jgi:hypothetical protein